MFSLANLLQAYLEVNEVSHLGLGIHFQFCGHGVGGMGAYHQNRLAAPHASKSHT